MNTFGERLTYLRKKKKFSQEKLAELVGKAGKTTISAWETGKAEPTVSDIEKLCDLLETTSDFLIKGILPGSSDADIWKERYYRLLEENNQLLKNQNEEQAKKIEEQKV